MVANSWQQRRLEGWGRFRRAETTVFSPSTQAQLPAALAERPSLLAFGKGRSYGDAPLNQGGGTVLFHGLDRVIEFRPEDGVIRCEAGIPLEDVLEIVIPHGWFLPVTPGTRYPTLGGCLAADVHGKNHHVAGTISRHVQSFRMLLADGRVVSCSPDENRDLFLATAGGMGLTGLILDITLALQRVETSWIRSETVVTASLRETMDQLIARDRDWPYTVAWVDCTATGNQLGRGEVILGRHARSDEIATRQQRLLPPDPRITVPFTPPVSLVNPWTTRLFNELYSRKHLGRRRVETIESAWSYFYPLDVARGWNRIYGPRGFVQYQYVVPMEAGYELTRDVLRRSLQKNHPSSLSVLKRFGPEEGLLSFPMEGWTMALDIAVRPGLMTLLSEFDRMVEEAGGRIYLAKDARLSGESFRRMYPNYATWLEIKRRVDPECLFSSDLSRRLGIDQDVLGG